MKNLEKIMKVVENMINDFLQVMDNAELEDLNGRQRADFSNVLIIMTTNASEDDRRRSFCPEFLSRINKIVEFNPMGVELAISIARKTIEEVKAQLAHENVVLVASEACYEWIARNFASPQLGIRKLKSSISEIIQARIAPFLICNSGKINVELSIVNNRISMTIQNSGHSRRYTISAQDTGIVRDLPPSPSDAVSYSR